MIAGRINVMKVDKSRLVEGKHGEKWLEIVCIDTPNNQYGDDYMIVQGLPKEERASGKKGPILGNCKYVNSKKKSEEPSTTAEDSGKPDDVPF